MDKNLLTVIYLFLMLVSVVIVDIAFFRHMFIERLIANIGVVFIYLAFYLVLIKNN
jgi:hypothetical protein